MKNPGMSFGKLNENQGEDLDKGILIEDKDSLKEQKQTENIVDDSENNPDKIFDKSDSLKNIENILLILNPREREVIKLYNGIGEEAPLTFEQISQRPELKLVNLNEERTLTGERIRQIYEGAMKQLRQVHKEKDKNVENTGKKQSSINESLNKALSELSSEDVEIVREEFKILNKAVIPNLVSKVGNFKLIQEQSEEIKKLAESGRMPVQLRDKYGTQEDLDKLLDELNSSKEYVKRLKDNLLKKDIEAIKKERDKRIEILNQKLGGYSLTGKEYQDAEDRTNRKIADEERIKQLRDDLEKLMNPN